MFFDHFFRYRINVTNNKTKPEQIKRQGLKNSFNRLETIIKPIILNDIEAINKTVKNRCFIYERRANWYISNQPMSKIKRLQMKPFSYSLED